MTYSHIIRKTLNIKDKNIHFDPEHYILPDETLNKITYKVLEATLTYTPKACEKCGTVNQNHLVIKNGRKSSLLKLGTVMFQPVRLRLWKQRFLCKACNQTFMAKTSLVQPHCFISNPIKSHIALELQTIQSMKAIGDRVAVSPHTVMRILKTVGETLEPTRHALPEHLSFDEFKSVKEAAGAMSFIFSNSQTHDVIDIIENRQQSRLIAYFQRYPYTLRKQVRTVTIDMYSPYIAVIEQCFPNAKLIIDRFHIVQHLNRALNRLRIEVMNTHRYSRPTDYHKLKKQWKLILKNSWKVDFETFYTHRLYDGLVSQKIMINYLLSFDEQFKWVYSLINDLKYSLSVGKSTQFNHHLERSKDRQLKRYIRTTMQTLEKYSGSISNSCTYTLSNGHLEGINNKIKTMKRSGYGYRNFRNLRARILISFKLTEKQDQFIRPVTFEEERELARQNQNAA
ncbi:ISL3 family transposase [Alkalibacterium olivapovliticus]|uniref:Transposase n=1 Tax=Alkalibacterium olivapovliticus TaxID=99907 RepID=A0A2T0VMZ6_9LACT|nr:ISL3 family transposase [Alkalibacterium olivapovliticus]PRY71608.1 transposase [Alkalibacterium olivapovliticus]